MKRSDRVYVIVIVAHLYLLLHVSRAELHHQRPLPRPSASIEPAEAISLHANASRATFAIGCCFHRDGEAGQLFRSSQDDRGDQSGHTSFLSR
ncbi:hypothetical protein WJX77_002362 [Trebouxia sp. C0004]